MARRGRKPVFDEKTVRDTAYLVVSDHELIVSLGEGSFTHGVRELADYYRAKKLTSCEDGHSEVAQAS